MRILYIAPATERIPPYRYGSVGRIVDQLVQGCFEHGQDVDLIASRDSRTKARQVIASTDSPVKTVEAVRDRILDLVHRIGPQYDVVHNHESVLAPYLESVRGVEVLTTCHLEQQDVWSGLSHQWLVTLSADQAARVGSSRIVDTIPPCINISEFDLARRDDRNYLLVLSKLSQKKGIMDAIQIARASSRKLVLAGPVFPKDRPFYLTKIAPEIDGEQIIYYGEAVEAERRELICHASGLLFPNLYGEPFGIVMLEALASGVPVIATGANAASEVVIHGSTGFLGSGVEDAAAYVDRLSSIDPVACRLSAERFNYHVISASYLRAYASLLRSPHQQAGCSGPTPNVFLLRGQVNADVQAAIVAAVRRLSTSAVVSAIVPPDPSTSSMAELIDVLSQDARVVLLWDRHNTVEPPSCSMVRRHRIADIMLVGRETASPAACSVNPGLNFRTFRPSTMLSVDLPTDLLARQLIGLGRLRFGARAEDGGENL